MTRLTIPLDQMQDVFESEPHYTPHVNVGLDYVMMLADAKYIAKNAGNYTEAQRVSIFNTIAVLQCAIREEM